MAKTLTDEEIARRCPGCQFSKWRVGVCYCTRRTCKYRTSYTSRLFKDGPKGGSR
jgi:hypothetical protein